MQKQGEYQNWLMRNDKEWYDQRVLIYLSQFYLDPNNQFQSAGPAIQVIRKDYEDDQFDLNSAQTINNQGERGFNQILDKTLRCAPNMQKNKIQKIDQSSIKMQSVSSSSSRILSQFQKPSFEKDSLSLIMILKGDGFSHFRLLKLDIRIFCKQCGEFSESKIVGKQEPDLFFFESKCCSEPKTTFQFKKVIQKTQNSQWSIGQFKFSSNVEISIKKIQILPICNCKAMPEIQRLPKIDIKCEERVSSSKKQYKCEQIEKQRYLCQGCCKEIIIIPDWICQV